MAYEGYMQVTGENGGSPYHSDVFSNGLGHYQDSHGNWVQPA